MDMTDLLNRLAPKLRKLPKLPKLTEADRAVITPLIDHMHAGVIRPVTDDERDVIVRLSGGSQ